MSFTDLSFARRLEMITARSCKACSEAATRISTATLEIAGGIAAFTGVDSPITQAFGVGMDGPVTAAQLDELEQFFLSRGAAVTLELCPFIDQSLVEILKQRPYRLEEFSSVLFRELDPADRFATTYEGVEVRLAEPDEMTVYSQVVTEGFAEQTAITDTLRHVVESFFANPRGRCFLAYADGQIAGGDCVAVDQGLAELSGASTKPGLRRRGVQSALITARLDWAMQEGCDMATTTTQPGSGSQRNYERFGFRVAHSRTKLVRDLARA